MKKIFTILLGAIFLSVCSTAVEAQKLGKFGGLTQKKMGPKKVRVPYTDVIIYMGYAAPGTEDEVKDGKKFYYLYLWIPAVAPELGVRMMSPGGDAPDGAIMAEDFEANADSKDYFDTYITLERSDIVSMDGLTAEKAKNAKWFTLDKNDDSSEMPALPSGSKYNSLLRYKSDTSDPMKALSVGLYRVGFTTFKKGEVKGTFRAEVGAPVALPGVGVAKTIDELNKQLAK